MSGWTKLDSRTDVEKFVRRDEFGNLEFATSQNVDGLLLDNKLARDAEVKGVGSGSKQVAEIPTSVIMAWMHETGTFGQIGSKEVLQMIKKKLRDNPQYKTTTGRI